MICAEGRPQPQRLARPPLKQLQGCGASEQANRNNSCFHLLIFATIETFADPEVKPSVIAMAASSLSDDEASGTGSRKRKIGRSLNPHLWEHSRKPIPGVESTRNSAGRRIWYCSRIGCEDYSVVSAAGIRWHLERHHGLLLGEVEPGAVKKAKQQDLAAMFGDQRLVKDKQAESEIRDLLRSVADRDRIQQAVLRLIVRRDLPLRLPCWPEMNTLIHAANYMATTSLWDSPTTTANYIKRTFEARRIELAALLRRSRSKKDSSDHRHLALAEPQRIASHHCALAT